VSKTQYNPNFEIDRRLIAAGASKTIYALVMPETERVLLETIAPILRQGATQLDETAFSEWLGTYHGSWTRKQDAAHAGFFSAWRDWVEPVADIGDRFEFMYPTAGASEGLIHLITSYGNIARKEKFEPVIHIFEGEYEGYPAYAESQFIAVRRHCRSTWETTLDQIGPRDQVYVSQPSAIDGNLWQDFSRFAARLHERQPTAEVIADLTYVGAVARDYHVSVDYPNVKAVVFSLSKPMGVYYHRIGGLFSQAAMPSLFGNQWFKNLLSLRYGTELLRRFGVRELPQKSAPLQRQAAAIVATMLNVPIEPADVMLLGTVPAAALRAASPDVAQYVIRAPGDPIIPARLCLTPGMAGLIESAAPRLRMAAAAESGGPAE
jgi:hypothetical protein